MRRDPVFTTAIVGVAVLMSGLAGCESFQRKFTRKPKHPPAPPTPVITFQDYSRAMTPLDRYRKHYLMFDYWSSELMDALQSTVVNPKRLTRASVESLGELKAMKDLLIDERAAALEPLIEAREKLGQELTSPAFGAIQASLTLRALEVQERLIHREFFWRDVEQQLKDARGEPPAGD